MIEELVADTSPDRLRRTLIDRPFSRHSPCLYGLAIERRAAKSRRPLVFLNAAGNEAFGAAGMARQLIAVGAGAVIAPMWAVKDQIASEVAVRFYEEVARQPTRPFAEILRDIRRRAQTGDVEDSYLAYRFFGSPLAAAASAA